MDDDAIEHDPKAVKKILARHEGQGFEMLARVLPDLEACDPWSAEALQALTERLCAEYDTKLGNIAQPVRVAVTGTSISPPIFDTLVILGKQRTLTRIHQCLATRP